MMDAAAADIDTKQLCCFDSEAEDCDQKRLLLKKNFSWTGKQTAAKSSLIAKSRSNPHVLDGDDDDRRAAKSLRKLSLFLPKRFYSQTHLPTSAPIATAISTTSSLTATTTTTAIVMPSNVKQRGFCLCDCRAIVSHCKVNKRLSLSLTISRSLNQ